MRTKLLGVLWLSTLYWACPCLSVLAENYPARPIHMIVPSAAGNAVDVSVRRVAETVSRKLGQPVIVDNRPGTGGSIAAGIAARVKPDGYTVFVGGLNSLCLTPLLYQKITYNPTQDFTPVTLGTRGNPILLVNPELPVRTLTEFVSYAKANPGRVSYGSPSIGSVQHLAMVHLGQLTGVRMLHVPYKDNSAQVLTDVMAGHIQAAVEFGHIAVPHIKAGKLRALAIVGDKRKPILPDIPTSTEAGVPGFDVTGWHGYLVPTGTPPQIVDRLNAEIGAALKSQDYSAWAVSMGSEIGGGTSEQFRTLIRTELERWGRVIKDSDVTVE